MALLLLSRVLDIPNVLECVCILFYFWIFFPLSLTQNFSGTRRVAQLKASFQFIFLLSAFKHKLCFYSKLSKLCKIHSNWCSLSSYKQGVGCLFLLCVLKCAALDMITCDITIATADWAGLGFCQSEIACMPACSCVPNRQQNTDQTNHLQELCRFQEDKTKQHNPNNQGASDERNIFYIRRKMLDVFSWFCLHRCVLLLQWLHSQQWREFSQSLGGEGHCNPPRGASNTRRPSEASAPVSISNRGAIGDSEGHLVLVVWSRMPRAWRKKGNETSLRVSLPPFQEPCRPAGCHLAGLLSLWGGPPGVCRWLPSPVKVAALQTPQPTPLITWCPAFVSGAFCPC